jgi:hypothetical protein
MSTTTSSPSTHRDTLSADRTPVRASSETKPSSKTTELYAYVAAVVAVVLTALVVGDDGSGGGDPFGASEALRYVTYLTIGYMVARGLAKAGSRGHHDS